MNFNMNVNSSGPYLLKCAAAILSTLGIFAFWVLVSSLFLALIRPEPRVITLTLPDGRQVVCIQATELSDRLTCDWRTTK